MGHELPTVHRCGCVTCHQAKKEVKIDNMRIVAFMCLVSLAVLPAASLAYYTDTENLQSSTLYSGDWNSVSMWTDVFGDQKPSTARTDPVSGLPYDDPITDITRMWLAHDSQFTYLRLELNDTLDGVSFIAGIALDADEDASTGASAKIGNDLPWGSSGIDYSFGFYHFSPNPSQSGSWVNLAYGTNWIGSSFTLAAAALWVDPSLPGRTNLEWKFDWTDSSAPDPAEWKRFCGYTREINEPNNFDKLCVPEPGTYALLALALGVPFYFRRRKS